MLITSLWEQKKSNVWQYSRRFVIQMESSMNYTYIVKCADETFYTGWTNCLQKRLKAHNEGKNGSEIYKGQKTGDAGIL